MEAEYEFERRQNAALTHKLELVRRALVQDEIDDEPEYAPDGTKRKEGAPTVPAIRPHFEAPPWLRAARQRLKALKKGKVVAEEELETAKRSLQDTDILQEEIRRLKIKAGLPEDFRFDHTELAEVVDSDNQTLRRQVRELEAADAARQKETAAEVAKLQEELEKQSMELAATKKDMRNKVGPRRQKCHTTYANQTLTNIRFNAFNFFKLKLRFKNTYKRNAPQPLRSVGHGSHEARERVGRDRRPRRAGTRAFGPAHGREDPAGVPGEGPHAPNRRLD